MVIRGGLQRWVQQSALLGSAMLRSEGHLHARQADSNMLMTSFSTPEVSSPTSLPGSSNFVTVLSNYWYVCLVLVVVGVVSIIFLCACIVRRKKRRLVQLPVSTQAQLQSAESASSRPATATRSQRGITSSILETASRRSLSIGQSPFPSPQPSFSSSHKSARSSGRGSGRKKRRHHSPGHTSSGSEDTIRPYQGQSMSSLASSVSTLGPHSGRGHRTESMSSGRGSDRGRSLGGDSYSRSTSQVKITAISDESPLHSTPSTLSITSSQSHSASSRHLPSPLDKPAAGHIQVDVKVHLEQEKTAPFQIAAALAESARQLAQSAANFEQEDNWTSHSSPFHYPRSNLSSPRASISGSSNVSHATSRRQLFANHSASALFRERQNSFPMVSLDRPGKALSLDRQGNVVSLDRPGESVVLDRSGNMASLNRQVSPDRPGTTASYRPGNSVSPDRPGTTASYRPGPGNSVSLDRPTNPFSLDRRKSLERTRVQRRNSTTSHKSIEPEPASPSPSARPPAMPDHIRERRTYDLDSKVVEVGCGYSSDGSVKNAGLNGGYYPNLVRHLHVGRAQSNEEGPTASLDFTSSRRPTHDTMGSGMESGCGTGTNSNASTLKAHPHYPQIATELASQTSNDRIQPHPSEQHAPPLSHTQEAPSPHSSQPSLSRSGSGMSLDPQLSSTASGYAATGSTSSLDTLSKPTQPNEPITVATVARGSGHTKDHPILFTNQELRYAHNDDTVMRYPVAFPLPGHTAFLTAHQPHPISSNDGTWDMDHTPMYAGFNRQLGRAVSPLEDYASENITIDV